MRELFALYTAAMLRPQSQDDILLRMMHHHQWAFHPEFVPLEMRLMLPESRTGDGDVELCERLIRSFRLASEPTPEEIGPIWGGIVERAYGRMVAAMESPELLAEFLSTVFGSETVEGMGTGEPPASSESVSVWMMKLLDGLVSLAEMTGTIGAENPEQNPSACGLLDGIETLVVNLESAIGVPLSFPLAGGAYGFSVGERLLTMEMPEHLEAAYRVARLYCGNQSGRIVEIGAGFGGTAYWINQIVTVADYGIFDLPFANILQGYFLSKALGFESVSLYGEPRKRVHIEPCGELFSSGPADILVNQNSMPEMPQDVALSYLVWASSNIGKLFYSLNQECAMPIGEFRQNIVGKLAGKIPAFERLSRSPSWVRSGYVEEVYAIHKEKP
jgi:hypothetical protein